MKEGNSFHFANIDYFMWIQTGSLMRNTKLVAIRLKGAFHVSPVHCYSSLRVITFNGTSPFKLQDPHTNSPD